jgi:hypothetical protein
LVDVRGRPRAYARGKKSAAPMGAEENNTTPKAWLGKQTFAPPGGDKAIARSATLPESPQGMTENSHGRQPVGPKVENHSSPRRGRPRRRRGWIAWGQPHIRAQGLPLKRSRTLSEGVQHDEYLAGRISLPGTQANGPQRSDILDLLREGLPLQPVAVGAGEDAQKVHGHGPEIQYDQPADECPHGEDVEGQVQFP